MNRRLKTALFILMFFLSMAALGSGIVSYYFQEEVMRFVIESINKQVSSRIQVGSAHFSVIRKFPNAAVEFRHVLMSPAKDFDTLSFEPARSRHLLSAGKVFVELNLFRLLSGDYRIKEIEVYNGSINLLTDKNNRNNFNLWKTSENSTGDTAPIELQNVTLHNMDVYYGHHQTNTTISLYAGRAQLSGRFTHLQYSVSAGWHGSVRFFSIGDDVLIRDKPLELSGKLDAGQNTFTIHKCDVTLAKVKMTVSGGFSVDEEIVLDLLVDGKQLDYASLVSLLPESYGQKLHDYSGKGNMIFAASIKGKAGNGAIPQMEATFGMAQGQIARRHSKIKLSGLSFSGTFTTGVKNQRTTSTLHIKDFACNIGDGLIKGNLVMQNFARPQITARISAMMDMEQICLFFPAGQIASAGGRMRCELTANTRLKNLQLAKTDDMDQLKIDGTVKFENASVHLRDPGWRLSGINGSMQVGQRITTNNLSLTLNGNDMKINGYLDRWSTFLLNRSKTVYVKANVWSQMICADSLLTTSAPTSGDLLSVTENTVQESGAPLLPANVELESNLETVKFRYGKFEAESMKAHLVYHPGILEIRSLGFAAMSGKLTGNGVISNDMENRIHVRGETVLDRFEVGQLFRSFDNFGQDVICSDHVKGRLSGDLGFAIGWDHQMNLLQDELNVEGLLNLNGGELINFEPMNHLSSFVALEELQNIHFSNLRTRISVKNRKITLPQTDIRSSAFDITGSGEHFFDNSYTYRVKILLSELLAAKARRAKRENRENEYPEDGGKRTALYLKVVGKSDDFKITYDARSAKTSIAEDIRNERQTMKSILKEEFGFFRKDTLVKPAKPDNSGQLKFTFDDE